MMKGATLFLVGSADRSRLFFVVIKKQSIWTVQVSNTNFSKAAVVQGTLLNSSSNEQMLCHHQPVRILNSVIIDAKGMLQNFGS